MDGPAESPVASTFRDARAELQNALSELQTDLARVLEEKVSDFQMLLAELPSELPAGIPIVPAPSPKRDMTKELMETGPAVEKAVRIEGQGVEIWPMQKFVCGKSALEPPLPDRELVVLSYRVSSPQGMELHSGTSAPRSSARSTRASGMRTLEQELFVSKWLGRLRRTPSEISGVAFMDPGYWYDRREKSYVGYVQKGLLPVTTVVIMANCLTLLISANWAMENQSFDIPQELRYLDLGFTIFYVLELLLKFFVHRLFIFWREDWKWNVFDFVLVAMAVQEQVVEFLLQNEAGTVTRLSYMRSLRVARVSRILRLLRAIRVIRELRMMVFSIISSFTALFWCLVLISLVICVFALFFLQICTDYLIVERDSIGEDVYTDFQRTFGSLTKTMHLGGVCLATSSLAVVLVMRVWRS
ncbi:Cacna1e [Symbiodinium sp. KB8]|nr:Cacna1e [Symbiodinium sp. KB8]